MTLHLPIRGVNLLRPGAVLLCLLTPLSLHSNLFAQDQDVAEAARQQQAQKSQQPASPRHVYTDEDLKRSHILTPEDKKLAEARRKGLATPAAKNPPAIDATNPPPESLGEVARRYRKEKTEREAETAAAKTKKGPAPFRVELPSTTLAEPKRPVASLRAPFAAARPLPIVPSPAPARRPAVPSSRVSPFSPPSYPSPAPNVNPSTLVPSREFQQLQVRPGDSLWRMARRYLGDGARWQEFLALNPGLAAHPDTLATGSTVIVPAAASKPVHTSPPAITVQAGDSLWSLARVHLGRGSDWPRLAHVNPQVSDYLHLQVGSQLQLPPH